MDIFASFNEEDEVIQHCEPNITFIVDDSTFGKGTLYVAESKLYWKNGINSQVVSVDYSTMCVFGTCNHPTIHEKPCMQIIVDFTYKPLNNVNDNYHSISNGNHEDQFVNEEDNDSENNDAVDEEEEIKSKIKIVPDNSESLTEIYGAFTRIQPLHNSNDISSDENDDFYYNENDEYED